MILTRDWKGNYDKYQMKSAREMILVGGEEEVQGGSDSQCLVFADKPTELSASKIVSIHNRLDEEPVRGFDWDEKDPDVVIEK